MKITMMKPYDGLKEKLSSKFFLLLIFKKLAVTRSKKKHKEKMLTFRFSKVGKKFFPKE